MIGPTVKNISLTMNIKEIQPDIYYVGVNDRVTEKFEAQWPLPYGVTYNSYLVKGSEATAIIDGVKIDEVLEFFNNLGSVKPDYLVVNHMEPDHSGAIPEIAKAFPDLKIIGNAQTIGMVKGFCHIEDDARFITVKDGDEISLGNLTLRFYLTPMVHWPETMMTYVPESRLLFSGDGFGTFGALNGAVIDRDMDTSIYFPEMYRYYSNIVGKYGKFVLAALKKLEGLDLEYICPTHGPVWNQELKKAVEITRRLASYESEEGTVIVYASMYGNTAEVAELIASELAGMGEKKIIVHSLTHSSMSQIISDAFRYRTLIVGSCVYSMRLFPAMESFLHALETREIKNKIFAGFGNFTWAAGVAAAKYKEFAERLGLELTDFFAFKQSISPVTRTRVSEFAEKVYSAAH